MAERIFGKYEKIRRLAQGGMGDVFLCRQNSKIRGFDRLVILKSLRSDLAEEEGFLEQFLDEARVAANLNHPNVVSVYEVGEWEGTHYIAMEYINGEDLSRLWYAAAKKGLGLPFSVTVKIIHDACLGLEHAHRASDVHGIPLHIVHRDISPQNIMVRGDGVTKVVDFGIARSRNRVSKTQVGTVKGKLQYMSPEQVRGEALDGRSDLFSLGVVLWEMCTGKRLFKAESEIDTLNKILSQPVPAPSGIVKNFPGELETVILRMLERDRDKRYPSCAAVADDLKAYLDKAARSKAVGVPEFVSQVLGDTLAERTRDLTPEVIPESEDPDVTKRGRKTRTGERSSAKISVREELAALRARDATGRGEPSSGEDPEEDVATLEGEPIDESGDGRITIERMDGWLLRFGSLREVQAEIAAGKLARLDRLVLGSGRSVPLEDHPDLSASFATSQPPAASSSPRPPPAPPDDRTGTWVGGGLGAPTPLADAMPSPREAVAQVANPSLMAVPQPVAPPSQGLPPTAPPTTPPTAPTAATWSEGPVALGPLGVPSSPGLATGPVPLTTGPWGPAAPPYQLPTSPPGYPVYPGTPGMPHEQWRTPTTAGEMAAVTRTSFDLQVPMDPPRSRVPWLSVLLVLVVVGIPAGFYVGDRPTFDRLVGKARGLLDEPSPLSADALRGALLSDDATALRDALAVVDPVAAGDGTGRGRALAAAASALLHANMAQIELERARLLGISAAAGEPLGPQVEAAEQAAEQHLVAAYKGATTARSLAGELLEAHVAMAAYQGLRGAVKEMEADIESALQVAGPEDLGRLHVESLGLRAQLESRRALSASGEEAKEALGRALKEVRAAREAAMRAKPAVDDVRLAYAEAALLVELAYLDAEDAGKTRAVVDALARVRPDHERLRWLAKRAAALEDKGGAGKVVGKAAPKRTEGPKANKELSFDDLKSLGDRARRRGQTYRAKEYYQKALALNPRSAPVLSGLGWCYLDLEKEALAIDTFERALRVRADFPEAVMGQAEALRYSGQRSAAVRAYKHYLEVAPDGADAAVARNAIKALGD